MIGWGRTRLVGPSVGMFLPGRVAKLHLVVIGSFAALMFRSLGRLCIHCQEATFSPFCMHLARDF